MRVDRAGERDSCGYTTLILLLPVPRAAEGSLYGACWGGGLDVHQVETLPAGL